jgi:hypothetical protein
MAGLLALDLSSITPWQGLECGQELVVYLKLWRFTLRSDALQERVFVQYEE